MGLAHAMMGPDSMGPAYGGPAPWSWPYGRPYFVSGRISGPMVGPIFMGPISGPIFMGPIAGPIYPVWAGPIYLVWACWTFAS